MNSLRQLILILIVVFLSFYLYINYVYINEIHSVNKKKTHIFQNDSSRHMLSTDLHAKMKRTVSISLRQWKLNMYKQRQYEIGNASNPIRNALEPVKNTSLLVTFRPTINSDQYLSMLEIWDLFTKTCVQNGITYILYGGTLLGSYRHHGFILWDDDLDVIVNQTDTDRLQHALSKIEGYGTYRVTHCLKFYKLPEKLPEKKHRFYWPFVDIFFYKENSTHVCDAFWDLYKICWEKAKYFPVKYRPLEDNFHPVPADVVYALNMERKQDPYHCRSNHWNHQLEKRSNLHGSADCNELFPFYPFVHRTYEERAVREILIVNDTVINECIFNF